MPRPSHLPCFNNLNNIRWEVQTTRHNIMQFSPVTSYFPPLDSFHSLSSHGRHWIQITMQHELMANLVCVLCMSLRPAQRHDATRRSVLVIQTNVRPRFEETQIQHRPTLREMLQFALTGLKGWTTQDTDRRKQFSLAAVQRINWYFTFPKFDEIWPSTYLLNGRECGRKANECLPAVSRTHPAAISFHMYAAHVFVLQILRNSLKRVI